MNINKSIKINFLTFIYKTSTHTSLVLYLLFINLMITKVEQNGDNGLKKKKLMFDARDDYLTKSVMFVKSEQ